MQLDSKFNKTNKYNNLTKLSLILCNFPCPDRFGIIAK